MARAKEDQLISEMPTEGFTAESSAKRKNMVRAAEAYLAAHEAWDRLCRFDLVCVTFLPGQPPRMDHYRNVIELGKTLDSRNPAWQPW